MSRAARNRQPEKGLDGQELSTHADFVESMKLAGFLLLPAGWAIVLTAISILPPGSARGAFLVAGLVVEILGMGLVFRAHMPEPPPEPSSRGPISAAEARH